MTDIGFYHLTATALDRALTKLLEKTLEAGERAVVRLASAERVQALNGHLWTYEDRSWLPHGTEREGEAELQPVWLTDREEIEGSGPLSGIGPTDPLDADGDDDGIRDGDEVNGTGPLSGYGPTDPTDADSDDTRSSYTRAPAMMRHGAVQSWPEL